MEGGGGGSQLFRAWRTVVEMLTDRGYAVDPRLLAMSAAEWEVACPTRLTMTLHVRHMEQRERELRVLWIDKEGNGGDDKIRKPSVAGLLRRRGDGEHTRLLLVFVDELNLTAPAIKVIDAINEDAPGLVQWFFEEELVVNVVRRDCARGTHYSVVTDMAPMAAMGRLYECDRVARYFGMTPGQVLRIQRRSESAGGCVLVKQCVAMLGGDRENTKHYL